MYLRLALNEADLDRNVPEEHDYAIPASTNLLPHVENVADFDFTCKPNENSEDLLTLVETFFAAYQFASEHRYNRSFIFGGENCDISKIKKLVSFLDNTEDKENRNRLCWIAFGKYKEVLGNPYIKTADKKSIHNTYIRSIVHYCSCSSWSQHAKTKNILDSTVENISEEILRI